MSILSSLWELTREARWFSGRNRGGHATGYALSDWIQEPVGDEPGIRPASLTVAYPGQAPERYFIPLVWRRVGSQVAPELFRARLKNVWYSVGELVRDPRAGSLLLAALARGEKGFIAEGAIPSGLEATLYGGEQSNSTLFFGDRLLCKLFRRIYQGVSPDVELHQALADTGTVARFHGVWRHAGADLAIFLEALPEPRDGYVLASGRALADEDFTDDAGALGSALAQIHRTLAARLPGGHVELADVGSACLARFELAAAEISELERYRTLAVSAFGQLGGKEASTQRIHGDCHLGQVLLTSGGWRYVDFEGEPLKSMAERRRPDIPLRDVAGMLRSFDYAAASVGPGVDRRTWLLRCRAAFLAGYGLGDGVDETLLFALELDKAFYEVVYESRNRPTWRHVPIDSLARLARRS